MAVIVDQMVGTEDKCSYFTPRFTTSGCFALKPAFSRVFSFSRNRRERLVRLGSGQATKEPSIKCVYTSFIAKIILSEAVAATADQTAVRPSLRRRPRVSKLARRPRLSSCPL